MKEVQLDNALNNFVNFKELDFKPKQQYIDIYSGYDTKVKSLFTFFHQKLDELLKEMNDRYINGHYRAIESRELIFVIEKVKELKYMLKSTKFSFTLDQDYQNTIDFCYNFLSSTGGSEIPKDYEKITLKRYTSIFNIDNSIIIKEDRKIELRNIGEGSYAHVFSFVDPSTNVKYAKKRLKNGATEDEQKRFKIEFDNMNELSHPNILKAYAYNEEEKSYIMEYCDFTLQDFISHNNNKDFMNFEYRKSLAIQTLNGFNYLHKRNRLHRDLSYKNLLVKQYDDNIVIIKLADFGLMKNLDLDLTRTETEIKGTIIDDTLDNFKDYDVKYEIYGIGVLLWFIFTGKTSLKIDDSDIGKIVSKCITRNHEERYNNVQEIINDINSITFSQNKKTINNIAISKIAKDIDKNTIKLNILSLIIDDESGRLLHLRDLAGEYFQSSDGSNVIYLDEMDNKEKAYYKSSFEELIRDSLIVSVDSQNQMFEITSNGYEFYESMFGIS